MLLSFLRFLHAFGLGDYGNGPDVTVYYFTQSEVLSCGRLLILGWST